MAKKVLIIDDDIRNIFALTTVLECKGIQVSYADNGKEGINLLRNNGHFQAVLIDIMMPEIDGYEVIKAIRKLAQYKEIPIIALTAKALPGDREKCIEAGATEYLPKPVNTEQLFSLLRVYLYDEQEPFLFKNESIDRQKEHA